MVGIQAPGRASVPALCRQASRPAVPTPAKTERLGPMRTAQETPGTGPGGRWGAAFTPEGFSPGQAKVLGAETG